MAKRFIVFLLLTVIVGAAGLAIFYLPKNNMIQITSPAFTEGGLIPKKYTCQGDNINPPLEISNVPEGAQSLVLVVDDPDAPGGVFTHWILYNIDPKTTQIGENYGISGAVSGKNSTGSTGYVAPCPPTGTHRYFFTVYALDQILNLQGGKTISEINEAMQRHILGQGQLMGKFAKQ